MSRNARTNVHSSDKDRVCPRDGTLLKEATIGEATVDVCGKCHGTFFESGEMFAAFGGAADPATWDRPETGGMVKVKETHLQCPKCKAGMDAQEVVHADKHVEVDRCGKCRGVWLDKDEIDSIVAIGHAMQPLLAAERAKAQEELAKLNPEDATFRTPWKKQHIIGLVLLLGALVTGLYFATRKPPPAPRIDPNADNKEGGCPCGCDRSKAMAAALRMHGGEEGPKAIERALETISARENVGYITEHMIQHRLRMLDLAEELRTKDAPSSRRANANANATASIPLLGKPEWRRDREETSRIDQLLEALALAHSYEERQPIKRELYASGASALPHLDSIIARTNKPEIRRLASSTRKVIEARTARDNAAASSSASVKGEKDERLRVSAELIVHGERIDLVVDDDVVSNLLGSPSTAVHRREKLITPSFRLWLKIENLTDQPRTLKVPSLHARVHGADDDIHLPVSRWYEEDGNGQPWDGILPTKTTVRVNVIGDIPEHVKPGAEIDASIMLDALSIETTTEASGRIHLLVP